MKVQTTLHWNNFTVPELKEILEHCTALERLGIAQDEEMMCSMERDIAYREEKSHSGRFESKPARIKQPIARSHNPKQPPEEYLLEQTA